LSGGGNKFSVRALYKNPMEVCNKSTIILLVNDLPAVVGVDDAYIKRANYITYDRSSNTNLETDNDLYFKADDTIDEFIKNENIINSYVYLICEYYKKSCIKKTVRPDCVIHVSKEMSGYNESGNEYFNKFKLIDKETIKSYIKQERNDKGVWLVHWDKVQENYIECIVLYDHYIRDGFIISKVAFGKKLLSLGIIVAQRKVNNKSLQVYVGISDNNDD